MVKRLVRLGIWIWNDENGQAMVEFAIVTTLLGIVALASLMLIVGHTGSSLSRTGSGLTNAQYQ